MTPSPYTHKSEFADCPSAGSGSCIQLPSPLSTRRTCSAGQGSNLYLLSSSVRQKPRPRNRLPEPLQCSIFRGSSHHATRPSSAASHSRRLFPPQLLIERGRAKGESRPFPCRQWCRPHRGLRQGDHLESKWTLLQHVSSNLRLCASQSP